MYDTCQLKFRFAYVDKLEMPFEKTVSLAIGNTCHRALEYLYKKIAQGYQISHDMFIDYAKTKRTAEISDLPDVSDTDRTIVTKHLTRYYQTYTPFTQDKTIGIEVKFTIPLTNGQSWTGIIDRVALAGRTIKLIDYKTSHSIKTTANNEYTNQLKTYAMAASYLYPGLFDTIQAVIIYLPAQLEQIFDFDSETIQEHKQYLIAQTSNINQKITDYHFFPESVVFEHNLGKHCQQCPFLSICPAWTHKDMKDDDVTIEDLQPTTIKRLVDEYVIAKKNLAEQEKMVTMMADILKQYALQHNLLTLYGNKGIVGFRPTHKLTVHDKQSLYRILKNEGIFDELASINHQTLTSFIKNNPSILTHINKAIASWDATLAFGKVTINEEGE